MTGEDLGEIYSLFCEPRETWLKPQRSPSNFVRTRSGAESISVATTEETTGIYRPCWKSWINRFDHRENSGSKHPPMTDVSV